MYKQTEYEGNMTEILSESGLRSTTVMFLFVWFAGIWMGGCETQEQKVEKLIKQLQDDVEIRHYAIWELVEIGKDAVPFLIQALQDAGEGKNGSVIRLSVVEVLVKIGKDAVPDLIQALQDADSGVCVNVTTALGWRGTRYGTFPDIGITGSGCRCLSRCGRGIREYRHTRSTESSRGI